MNSFGENLKKIRLEKGISQKTLANSLNISQGTIANYEKNNRFPKERIMYMLSDYFGVSIDYLLGRVESEDLVQIEAEVEFGPISNEFYDYALKNYFELALKNDIESAYSLIYKLYKNGASLIEIYERIFENSLIKLGDLWASGDIDIGSEHQFSEITENIIARLGENIKKDYKYNNRVACMCVKNEEHKIACKMIANFLNYSGVKSYYIGYAIPFNDLERYIIKNNINSLVLSITLKEHEEELMKLLKSISKSEKLKNIQIILGGKYFLISNLKELFAKYEIALSIEDVVKFLDLKLKGGSVYER